MLIVKELIILLKSNAIAVAFEIPISRASLVKWENLEECISLFGDNDKVELLLHGNDLPIGS